jgi:hypothetical protein
VGRFDRIEIVASSAIYVADHIRLFEKTSVVEVASLTNQASVKLQGVHTGIGFLGSPGWVLGGSLLLGTLEGLATKSAAKEGLTLLEKAASLTEKLRAEGVFVPIAKISKIELPMPNSWHSFATSTFEQKLADLSYVELQKFIGRHSVSAEQIRAGSAIISTTKEFVYGGDEFVAIRCGDDERNIRWASVTSYRPLEKR